MAAADEAGHQPRAGAAVWIRPAGHQMSQGQSAFRRGMQRTGSPPAVDAILIRRHGRHHGQRRVAHRRASARPFRLADAQQGRRLWRRQRQYHRAGLQRPLRRQHPPAVIDALQALRRTLQPHVQIARQPLGQAGQPPAAVRTSACAARRRAASAAITPNAIEPASRSAAASPGRHSAISTSGSPANTPPTKGSTALASTSRPDGAGKNLPPFRLRRRGTAPGLAQQAPLAPQLK